jgi:hypothetical protein
MLNYFHPTPKKWRVLGDSLLAVSTFITTAAITQSNEHLAYISLAIGVVGKFLTNFFTEK